MALALSQLAASEIKVKPSLCMVAISCAACHAVARRLPRKEAGTVTRTAVAVVMIIAASGLPSEGPIDSGETTIDPIQLRLAVLCAGSQNGTSSLLGAAAG
jgi:hypothetical protein